MTDKEAMKLALEALQFALHTGFDESSESQMKKGDKAGQQHRQAINAIKERLADPMREVQRLGQEIEQEPTCPDCKAEVLYECVACSSNNYPPQRTEQEPVSVELPCCGYTDASAVKWNPFNGVVQCHNCGQTYTPPQRTEQEPVPTLEDLEQEIYQNTRNFISRDVMEWMLRRYYTHLPQRTWVGLTEHEHTDIAVECGCMSADWVFYGAAVERKVKERNQ